MVGLSDIPCVGVAVQRISEATVDAATRGLRYMLCYNAVVKQLNSEIEKVKIQEVAVSRKVDAAITDGKTIEKHVVKWQEDVENMKTLADELSKQTTTCTCFNVLPFPNPVSGFRLGRKAAHQSKNVAQLTVSGTKLVANEVGYLPADENVPTSNTTYHSFASRQEAYRKLWEALVDKNVDPILAIYGMPGVGKTRMMEQAWKEAKDNNIFDKVARVNVSSKKFNVINVQDKLASSLNCHLESKDNVQHRASQLKSSLMNGGKTLVILDDVWDVIPLNKVGIPFGDGYSKDCKILLTSRKQDVCLRNNCKDPIEIKTLTDGEAWEMFKNRVGSSKIETLKDASLAQKVCKKCADLPLLIDAVGYALKCVTENLWKDALYQLENHKFEEIEGIEPEVHACLQLSFEKLNVEARSCLLLCSLFPEDDDIQIKMLFELATGSQLLDRERNIDAVIDILKSSSLLLHDEYRDTVKLHDIIRDVARSIAARDPKYAFLSVRCSSRLPDNVDYHTPRLLQLDLEEDNVRFPDDLVFPDLRTLWLRGNSKRKQLSSGFFQRFMNLNFLVLQGMSFPDQQQMSIQRPEKLRGLILYDCNVQETFVNSISENLETLCIWKCDLPSTLDLPELKDLRQLELFANSDFNMLQNGISSLSSLEQLKILGGECTILDGDGDAISIFWDLSRLTRLKNLKIDLDYPEPYPDQDILNKLVVFNISVGSRVFPCRSRDYSKNLIRLEGFDIENGWTALVERAEIVQLYDVMGFANGFSNSSSNMRREANLQELIIVECQNMKHVASWEGREQQLTYTTFSNLSFVEITFCNELKYLFSASVAKCLPQMQQLKIAHCSELEEIVWIEEGRTDQVEIICFPNLKVLYLDYLTSLRSFSTHKVMFPNMEKMKMQYLSSYFSAQKIELGRDDSPPKLRTLVLCFDEQEIELPSQWLLQLENIEKMILKCCRWTGDFVFKATPTFFRRLRVLKLEKCEETKTISPPPLKSVTIACNMPALEEVEVRNCGFSTLFTSSAFSSLQKLSSLEAADCPLLESIVEDEMHDQTPKNTISLLRLTNITLHSLSSLKSFSHSSIYALDMPELMKVRVYDCPRMDTFSLSEVSMPREIMIGTPIYILREITDLNKFVREEVYGIEKSS